MVNSSDVERLIPGVSVIKEFPKSGQKKVFLVEGGKYGQSIFKFFSKGDLRVGREIEIITENKINNVPEVLDILDIKDEIRTVEYQCLVEEYIEGVSLTEKLSVGKLDVIPALKLFETLLDITLEMEKLGIVHRDIKPDNILIREDGKVYLIDFGIARLLNKTSLTFTQVEHGPHTPGYGAPELFEYRKNEIDSRSDLFSIGVVMYQAFTGQHPFLKGDEWDCNEIWYKTQTVIPKHIDIEGDVENQLISFIQILMEKYITRRPPTARKARDWFDSVLSTLDLEV